MLRRASRSHSSTPPYAPFIRELSREIFARLEKADLRPPFLGQAEIDPCRCEIHQLAGMIDGEIFMGLFSKLPEPLLIARTHPARHSHIDWLENALHPVFVLQTKGDYFELQLADGAENQVIVAQRLEQLRGALFAELREALLQSLHPQRILENRAAKYFGSEIRHSGEREVFALGE